MAFAGPRRKEQEETCTAVASHRMSFVRLEVEERPRDTLDRFVGGFDTHRSVEHEQQCGLLDAVLAESLAAAQLDEDGPLGAILRVQDGGRPRTVRGLDLGQPPVTHERAFPAPA